MAIDKYRRQSLADQNKHIRQGIMDQMDSDARKIKEAKEEYAKRGSGKFTNEGAEDRLFALPYDEKNLLKHQEKRGKIVVTEGDVKSYQYGYYIRSMEKLVSIIKYPEIRPDLDIEAIGYNDAQDINIKIELLPEEVKNCKAYLEGYRKGLTSEIKRK